MQKYIIFVFAVFVFARTASIPIQPIDIPVIVVYDDYQEGVKIRRSPGVFENAYEGNSVHNLDEKVQLSPDELAQAVKYIRAGDASNAIDEVPQKQDEVPQKQDESTYQALGEASTSSASPVASLCTTEETNQNPNYVLLIQIAQTIVTSGLNNIRDNLYNLHNHNLAPFSISDEQWSTLNRTITSLFTSLLQRNPLFKSNNDKNIVNEIVDGFKDATDTFVENLRDAPAQGTTAKPGAAQNIVNIVTSGFQQIAGNLANLPFRTTTHATVLNDAASTTAAGPFAPIQGIISGIQQLFNGPTTAKTPGPGSLSTVAPGPGSSVQNLVNQIGQGIESVVPGGQGAQGTNPIQQGVSSVVNQVSALNPLQSSAAPNAQHEQSTAAPSKGPLQQVQSFFNNAGQTITNFFQGQAPGGTQPGAGQNPSGPIQEVIQNVQNAVSSVLNPSTPPPSAQHEGQPTQGPIQSVVQNVQNLGNQVFSNLNPFNRPGSSGTQHEGPTTAAPSGGPIQQVIQGFQNIANQIGSAITGGLGSTAAPGGSTTGGTGALAGGQNIIAQVSQAVGAINPTGQSSTPSYGAVVSQIVSAANEINPANQGASSPQIGSVTDLPSVAQEIVSQAAGLLESHH